MNVHQGAIVIMVFDFIIRMFISISSIFIFYERDFCQPFKKILLPTILTFFTQMIVGLKTY